MCHILPSLFPILNPKTTSLTQTFRFETARDLPVELQELEDKMTIRHQRSHLRCTKRQNDPAVWELRDEYETSGCSDLEDKLQKAIEKLIKRNHCQRQGQHRHECRDGKVENGSCIEGNPTRPGDYFVAAGEVGQ